MNNYKILGEPASKDIDAACAFIEDQRLPSGQASLDKQTTQVNFEYVINSHFRYLMYRHLGAKGKLDSSAIASRGAELAKTYFTTNWWRGSKEDARLMKKNPANDELPWFAVFSEGLLMSLLDDRGNCLASIAEWPESWMKPEGSAIPTDPLVGKLYILISNSFRKSELAGADELAMAIAKSRKKEPKLLLHAWQAALERNQGEFESRLKESVTHFESILREPQQPVDCIAFHQSVILAAARRLGLELPKFTPQIQARLMTAESTGVRK